MSETIDNFAKKTNLTLKSQYVHHKTRVQSAAVMTSSIFAVTDMTFFVQKSGQAPLKSKKQSHHATMSRQSTLSSLRPQRRRRFRNSNTQLVKMILLIVTGYSITCLPYMVYKLYDIYGSFGYFMPFMLTNSIVDVGVYSGVDTNFQR